MVVNPTIQKDFAIDVKNQFLLYTKESASQLDALNQAPMDAAKNAKKAEDSISQKTDTVKSKIVLFHQIKNALCVRQDM